MVVYVHNEFFSSLFSKKYIVFLKVNICKILCCAILFIMSILFNLLIM